MNNLLKFLVAFVFAAVSQYAMANNWGQLELNKTYSVEAWESSSGYFIPEASGTLTISSTNSESVFMAKDANGANRIMGSTSSYNPKVVSYMVEQGVTYYILTEALTTKAFDFVLTMKEGLELSLLSVDPEEGSTFSVSGAAQLSFEFSAPVNVESATISSGSNSASIVLHKFNNFVYSELGTVLFNWLYAQKIKAGDNFTVTLKGVRMEENEKVLCGDGTVRATFKVSKMPAMLESSTNLNLPFLSYYTQSDERGILVFKFSEDINGNSNKLPKAEIRYGSIDADEDGGYYTESLPVSIEGKKVMVDLRGKRRLASDMVSNNIIYKTINLGLMGVFDTEGNYAYSSGQGTMGSYWYLLDFKEIKGDVTSEFSPVPGSSLKKTSEIEIWFTGQDIISYDGVRFKSNTETILVPKSEIETEESDGGLSLFVPIPENMKTEPNVTVTLENLESGDGSDYTSYFTATYNPQSTTGISSTSFSMEPVVRFNLNGQPVSHEQSGILIEDGRKVIR